MKENNIQEVIYKYDSFSDVLGIKVNHEFQYGETVEMDDGILLDFDLNNVPVSLEVSDASKRFNLPKKSFDDIVFFKMDVCVEEKSISLNAVFCVLVDNIESTQNMESFASNINHIPNMVVKLALV
ncbi:MAG: DUF2283 domain-containing protein [Methanobrevibacter sp.]|uniref:DUF2283 domain-containing protein n=1 Tax=Methanobrevibacter sp. TaxID=66852 RepID=UPI0025FEC61C|nr:DUF2283 domain-containing protein [Methanobrevibacter sp.]MBQ6098520.1 DUF2283 domain-containing protein [Methanobrevibacter sp.]